MIDAIDYVGVHKGITILFLSALSVDKQESKSISCISICCVEYLHHILDPVAPATVDFALGLQITVIRLGKSRANETKFITILLYMRKSTGFH